MNTPGETPYNIGYDVERASLTALYEAISQHVPSETGYADAVVPRLAIVSPNVLTTDLGMDVPKDFLLRPETKATLLDDVPSLAELPTVHFGQLKYTHTRNSTTVLLTPAYNDREQLSSRRLEVCRGVARMLHLREPVAGDMPAFYTRIRVARFENGVLSAGAMASLQKFTGSIAGQEIALQPVSFPSPDRARSDYKPTKRSNAKGIKRSSGTPPPPPVEPTRNLNDMLADANILGKSSQKPGRARRDANRKSSGRRPPKQGY